MKVTTDDVRCAYRLLLGREPDAEGLVHHLDFAARHSLSPDSVARIIMASDEFRSRNNKPTKLREIQIGGVKIYPWDGDRLIGDSLTAAGDYEPSVLPVFLSSLRQGDRVLDVGANIGIFTLLAAKRVGAEGRIYAFEPIARNVQSICAGIMANGFDNVSLIPVAASDRQGAVAMHRNDDSSNGIVDVRAAMAGHADMAPTNRIDSLLCGIKRLDVIKIDIEGYEPCAWKGIRSLVERFRPLIFSEFSPVAIRNTLAVDAEGYLQDLFEFATQPIQVLHRDGSRASCLDPGEVMSEWRVANRRLEMDGNLHLDLMVNTK
jgi:FkbM family methyltransferase